MSAWKMDPTIVRQRQHQLYHAFGMSVITMCNRKLVFMHLDPIGLTDEGKVVTKVLAKKPT
jgi:hypothetical protein